jgi:ABC-type glycerol-3-phosphate transport system substrate-binding protein
VKFLSSEQGSKKMAEASLALPALMKVASSPAFLDDQKPLNKKLLLEAMKRGKFPPLCKNWTMIKSHIDEEFRSVWDGKLTIQEAMGRLKALLEKNPPVNH